MTIRKKTVKAQPKKMTVTALSRTGRKPLKPEKKESVISDEDFDKHLKAYMKEKETLMKNLSKR